MVRRFFFILGFAFLIFQVRALYPSKVNGETLKGAWPAIWMLGSGNGYEWPRHGEIDMMEAVNGRPKIYMATHSTNHNGGNAQHPSAYAYEVNADFTQGKGNSEEASLFWLSVNSVAQMLVFTEITLGLKQYLTLLL